MVQSIINKFFQNSLYIQLSPDMLQVRCSNGRTLETVPEVALAPDYSMLAYGTAIQQLPTNQQFKVLNPFKHPRMAVTDFDVAEKLFIAIYEDVLPNQLIRPIVVIQPISPFVDGLSYLEIRAFEDIAMNAGAAETYVWQLNHALSHAEIMKRLFKDEYVAQRPPQPPKLMHERWPFPLDLAHFWQTHGARKTVYIQYRRNWLSVRCVETHKILAGPPKILEYPTAEVHPFDHPRAAINNYWDAIEVLSSWIRAILGFQLRKPIMIIHPLEEYAEDLVMIEQRNLAWLQVKVGVYKWFVWCGRTLTDAELISGQFPQDAGKVISSDSWL